MIKSCMVGFGIVLIMAQLAYATESAPQRPLPTWLITQLQQHNIAADDISIDIRNLSADTATANTVLNHNINTPRLPASTLKLVTTYIALDRLGSSHRWQTQLKSVAPIKNGKLQGDLYIQGGGDPKLVKERLVDMFAHLYAQGVHHIEGDIILDDGYFAPTQHHPADFDDKPLRPYNAAPSGLLVNFSALLLTFEPEPNRQTATISYEPELANYTIPTRVTMRRGQCRDLAGALQPKFGKQRLSFSASYPTGCRVGNWSVLHPDPKQFAAQVILAKWLGSGGSLDGQVRYGNTPTQAQLLYSHPSLPLAQIIADINQYSNNVMTEQVLLSLPKSIHPNDGNIINNYRTAQTVVNQWWQHHLSSPAPHLTKASGLCRDCEIAPVQLADLLVHAFAQPHFDVFLDSLGIAGQSGTIKSLAYRDADNAAIGRAFVKTGTLDDVKAVAGYVHARSGKWYSLVAIINAPQVKSSQPILDSLMDWTARDMPAD